jgi:phospholipase C
MKIERDAMHSHSWKKAFSCALAISTAMSSVLVPASVAFAATTTQTPIQHVVVIFQENASFDHYFGTYPNAKFTTGETETAYDIVDQDGTLPGATPIAAGIPKANILGTVTASNFKPLANTPTVNGLTGALLTNNPNKSRAGVQVNPQRMRPADAFTCDHSHAYEAEQQAVDGGLMDMFPTKTGSTASGCASDGSTVMNYYDGNTATGLWNIAQHFAMNDNSFGSTFGPSTPGAINLVSGQTHGAALHFGSMTSGAVVVNPDQSATDIGDIDAFNDDCGGDAGSTKNSVTMSMTGLNIGNLLNTQGISWGWFQGGFAPTQPATLNANGSTKTPAVCGSSHFNAEVTVNGKTYAVLNPTVGNPTNLDIHVPVSDYVSHHAPFMYYPGTANPHHLRPSSVSAIGSSVEADGVTPEPANHNYDTSDFFAAVAAGNLPAVSFLKAPSYEDGHPQSSNPLTEQTWFAQVLTTLEQSPFWSTTAVIIAYDDSDGWYDHQIGPVVSPSSTGSDALAGTNSCGTPSGTAFSARCGRGPRLPFLVASPWAKVNYVDHTPTDQSSIMAFIEFNWNLGTIDQPAGSNNPAPANGQGSFDRSAGSILGMFDFAAAPNMHRLILDPIAGTVVSDN